MEDFDDCAVQPTTTQDANYWKEQRKNLNAKVKKIDPFTKSGYDDPLVPVYWSFVVHLREVRKMPVENVCGVYDSIREAKPIESLYHIPRFKVEGYHIPLTSNGLDGLYLACQWYFADKNPKPFLRETILKDFPDLEAYVEVANTVHKG